MSLTTTIKTIQDMMRKDVGVDGDAQRIGQLVWMLFLKILDEQEKQIERKTKRYVSPLKEEFRWRNWAATEEKDKEGEELIAFVNNRLFPALKDIKTYQGKSKLRLVIQSIFEDAHNYMKSGTLLRQVIKKIEEDIPLRNFEDQQHLGDVYEKLLKDLQSAGNAGEFYTPRALTQFIVDRIAPRLGETILDPACGTGGFLAQAVDYLNKNKQTDNAETQKKIEDAPRGIEKKPLPHMLAVTNMILHGIKQPFRIERKNTLELYRDWPQNSKTDIVMTNPPFGGEEEENIEEDFPNEFRTRETADLFVYFIYTKMLKNGGRCAIILPDGFLFGEGIKSRIKEDLLEKCNLHTIVRLPKGVFSPYTGINTNILFFEKTGKEKDSTKTIWFYEHHYPEGYKNYSKTRPMQFSEFKPEQEWWKDLYDTTTYSDRLETEFSWKIDFQKEKEQASAKAIPHYKKADEYENEKRQKSSELKELNRELKRLLKEIGTKEKNKKSRRPKDIEQIKDSISILEQKITQLDQKSKDERNIGDRIRYAIYNLDRGNPNSQQAGSLDPDSLLRELKLLQESIAETQNTLKNQMSQILLRNMEQFADAQIYIDNFVHITLDPHGVNELRRLILMLATQGKLIQQDSNDEPASELLKRIREIRGKGFQGFSHIGDDEIPFPLPSTWEWVRIVDVCHNWGQKKPDEPFTYIDVSSIDNLAGKIRNDLQIMKPENAPSRARKVIRTGSVIYSTVRPYLLNIAIVDREIMPTPIVSTAFYVMHPYQGVNARFLYFCLRSKYFTEFVSSQMIGVAYPAISDSKLEQGYIPLPPLAEQQRIIVKIDELISLCNQLESQLIQYRELQTKTNEAFLNVLTESKSSAAINNARMRAISDTQAKLSIDTQQLVNTASTPNLPPKKPNEYQKDLKVEIQLTYSMKKDVDNTTLAKILELNGGRMEAKELWKASKLREVDDFYTLLRQEIEAGFIDQPGIAEIRLRGNVE